LQFEASKKFTRPSLDQQLGTAACPCYSKILGRPRSGGSQFQASHDKKKKFMRPHLNGKKLGHASIWEKYKIGGS
jgi:DNA-directed RNA polymerase subunit RPC12/RpoP